ncbi:MAG: mitochondrial splicing system protein [Stictis urceolatum]|nr:mitochondrial splicing system protein [Stictis urceolata]
MFGSLFRHQWLLYGKWDVEPGRSSTNDYIIDSGSLVLYFPGPKTVTGEDVIEFHVHGGPAVVKAVLAAVPECNSVISSGGHSVRYAEPGEFTRRAFYNDRLDLTQVEALGETLSAETEQQRQLAVRSTSNTLKERYESWRNLLLQARGELEALIDFSEDQHFDDSPSEFTLSVTTQVKGLQARIKASIENAAKGELLRGGIKVALLGAPNVGKSSLLNRIVGRDAAIVSREAGTTRDVVEVNVDIGGYFCKLGDLAGLRASALRSIGVNSPELVGEVETEGIRRAKAHVLASDVVVVVLSLQEDISASSGFFVPVNDEIIATLSQCDLQRQRIVFAINKIDLLSESASHSKPMAILPASCVDSPVFYISCIDDSNTSVGTNSLLEGLIDTFSSLTEVSSLGDNIAGSWDDSLGASERQRLLLAQSVEHLDQFLACVNQSGNGSAGQDSDIDIVVAAECLRAAAQALGKITGRGDGGDVEEVLGVVFEKFCVGK